MDKKDWKKELQKLFVARGTDKEKMEISPRRDWSIVVALFMLGFIVSVGFNTYLFNRINEDALLVPSSQKDETVEFDREKLAKVLEIIGGKEAAFEELKNAPVSAVDPSL